MIRLSPHDTETLVVTHSWATVMERLETEIAKPFVPFSIPTLSGWISENRFQVTMRLRRWHAFMPVINGKIEPTSLGCLIFLDYTLLPGTRFFLTFWNLFILLTGTFIAVRDKEWHWPLLALVALVFINAIAWANFKMHRRHIRTLLMNVLG